MAAEPRHRVAEVLRRIITTTVAAELPAEALQAAATRLQEVADALEASGSRRQARAVPDPFGPAPEYFLTSPVIGLANPLAPLVQVESDGDGLRGTAWFDLPYEGPPGCVHGGVIAMLFDEVLGMANIAAGTPGMTGTLTVRYHKPTPLRAPLTVDARCHGRRGRKIVTTGTIHHGSVLTAEAEGIFVEVRPERFLDHLAAAAGPDAVGDLRARAGWSDQAPTADGTAGEQRGEQHRAERRRGGDRSAE